MNEDGTSVEAIAGEIVRGYMREEPREKDGMGKSKQEVNKLKSVNQGLIDNGTEENRECVGIHGRISSDRMREYLQLYLVVGSVDCKEDPVKVVSEALEGGATLVQFREKGPGSLTGEARLELAGRLRALCHSAGALFIVNDDVELALAVDADGVHIGQEDEAADCVRARIGERILGVSAITACEARSAIHQGADYLGIGPIYPTSSKKDARAVQGPQVLKTLRAQGIAAPIVGIGGITAARAAEVVSARADGVAVISAITQADDAQGAAATLKREVLRALASSSSASASQGSEA
ncbi:hypothetical protein GCM10008933_17280 [Paenibacillus motobuensis]|uniref:Thiamine-phosphate synthase n=1 Tax=Paenibacillus motobuensis TaxID=295324 RepID=A0ABN0Y8B4_9BACL